MQAGKLGVSSILLGAALAAACAGAPAPAPPDRREADAAIRRDWARPVAPFRIAGNLYYVGAADIAVYLFATSEGLILLDAGTREMEPFVRASIAELGFRLEDIRILLVSHAHFDHVEGLAAMKRLTGASLAAMAAEVPALSSGVDRSALGDSGWDPVRVDRVLRDGDDVVLGDVALHAVWTPGHTQGCTTWTTTARQNGRTYSVAIVCPPIANAGVKLVGNRRHPTIARDLDRSLRALARLRPDIFLTGHPAELLAGKIDRLRAGEEPNPLVDPGAYRRYLAEAEADYRRRLDEERRAR
jgi:metallo-beta-lactamase class B